MRKWRSHKIVEAEKIVRAGYDLHGEGQGWVFEFEGGDHENVGVATWNRCVKMAEDAVARGQHPEREPSEHPALGGYFVRYDDGYLSWSPAAAFDEGHELLSDLEKVGAHRIAVERGRQIAQEGYSLEHDDRHGLGELLLEAIRFAISAYLEANDVPPEVSQYLQALIFRELARACYGSAYPEPLCTLKPATPERHLEKAGALIAAEIDRLLRKRERDEADAKERERDTIPW